MSKQPVVPLPKNQDTPDTTSRAVDKRPKKIPLTRATAVRAAKPRAFAGRSTGGR